LKNRINAAERTSLLQEMPGKEEQGKAQGSGHHYAQAGDPPAYPAVTDQDHHGKSVTTGEPDGPVKLFFCSGSHRSPIARI
jgi:hypothetical protein